MKVLKLHICMTVWYTFTDEEWRRLLRPWWGKRNGTLFVVIRSKMESEMKVPSVHPITHRGKRIDFSLLFFSFFFSHFSFYLPFCGAKSPPTPNRSNRRRRIFLDYISLGETWSFGHQVISLMPHDILPVIGRSCNFPFSLFCFFLALYFLFDGQSIQMSSGNEHFFKLAMTFRLTLELGPVSLSPDDLSVFFFQFSSL